MAGRRKQRWPPTLSGGVFTGSSADRWLDVLPRGSPPPIHRVVLFNISSHSQRYRRPGTQRKRPAISAS